MSGMSTRKKNTMRKAKLEEESASGSRQEELLLSIPVRMAHVTCIEWKR